VCIGLNGSPPTNAATLFGCDGGTNQTWSIRANGTITDGSGKCLDVHDPGTANGTEVDYAVRNSGGAQGNSAASGGKASFPKRSDVPAVATTSSPKTAPSAPGSLLPRQPHRSAPSAACGPDPPVEAGS
jgi:Ricin-type beta-trefoil lectin domain